MPHDFDSCRSRLSPGLGLVIYVIAIHLIGANADAISLAGRWRFALDPKDRGVVEAWSSRRLDGSVRLPGTLAGQGIGDPVTLETPWTGGIVDKSFFTAPEYAPYREPGQIKVPFWLQPERYFAGATWFQRDVTIPSDWTNRRVMLVLERPHWETRVWVDSQPFGTNRSLSTPHEYDLGRLPPGPHTLTIRVDNRRIVDIGENSHAITDHTQGNWNGIVGQIALKSTGPAWIDTLELHPNPQAGSVRLHGRIRSLASSAKGGSIHITIVSETKNGGVNSRGCAFSVPIDWSRNDGEFDLLAQVPHPALWDEFTPNLYRAEVDLRAGAARLDTRSVRFGFRSVGTQGTQITINDQPVFIRGTLECCIFPKTGHPPTEIVEWRRVIRAAKVHGLNLLRFHSYCPPEAAFDAADELGMYLQVETCWANQSTSIGDGKPVDAWVYEETDAILRAYGNHPSFVLMPHGNEPGGGKANAYLAAWVRHYREKDTRRLWTSGAGWPQLPENQFHLTPDPRIQAWGGGLKSRINALPPATTNDYRGYIDAHPVPVISHEIGQWCVYPNFAEMRKYTGYLKPRNFEIFRELLDAHGLTPLARPFLLASGKLQALCYKEDIESALRTPGMAGFELLDLHDFPGQGTALVGVLDPFWEPKGYVTGTEFARFCGPTIPLSRLSRRVVTSDEQLEVEFEAAHYGPERILAVQPVWQLKDTSGRIRTTGLLPVATLVRGKVNPLGRVNLDFGSCAAPSECRLTLRLESTKGKVGTKARAVENDWNLWIYPPTVADREQAEVLVTSQLDAIAEERLKAGGRVLLTIPGTQVRNHDTAPVALGFSSIFWNTAWTGRQPPTTLGILCNPKHPALAGFPTAFHSDWQWWYLLHRAGALRLDLLPREAEPIVRVIDDWFTARPLGLVIEGRIGAGRIVVCGFDLTSATPDPVSRQMRRSLTSYMGGSRFRPAAEFTLDQVKHLMTAAP